MHGRFREASVACYCTGGGDGAAKVTECTTRAFRDALLANSSSSMWKSERLLLQELSAHLQKFPMCPLISVSMQCFVLAYLPGVHIYFAGG